MQAKTRSPFKKHDYLSRFIYWQQITNGIGIKLI